MMRKLVLSAAFCCLAVTAHARDVGGSYTVDGENFDGTTYSGTAEITITSSTTCKIVWTTGGTSSSGICMRNGDAFAAGYVLGDAIGLIIYQLRDDGVMEGLWTLAGSEGVGKEVLTPQ